MHDPMSWMSVRIATQLLRLAFLSIPLSACAVAILHPDRPPELYGLAFAQTGTGDVPAPLQQPVAVTAWGLGLIRGETGLTLSLGWSRLKEANLINSAEAPTSSPAGGTVLHIETVGLGYSALATETSVALGYSETTAVIVAPDSLVMGNPVTTIADFIGK